MSSPAYKPLVYIISAPSGSGKSTLVNELLKKVSNLEFSISYTTRAPRGSETDGRQYYFVSRPEFEKMIRDDEFLEHAEVFGNYYGTARRFLHEAEQNGRDLLLDIDVQGAAQIQHKLPDATSIFILPPDRRTLEERLRKRSEDREERPVQLHSGERPTRGFDQSLASDRAWGAPGAGGAAAIPRGNQNRGARGPLPPGQCPRPPEADIGLV